ncbi:Phospholipase/carboxylesterase/thioesterase [Mycena floridula]|nr:Phospholipase/carboxylesterase/thioesterase [Mycena floridula]
MYSHVKWILPVPPARQVTIAMGSVMPIWFDILSRDLTKPPQDEEGMKESIATIKKLIDDEIACGTNVNRIVLGGFSQGSTISLLAALTGSIDLSGLVVLGGRLPLFWRFKQLASERASSIPIFWGHSTSDSIVPFEVGKQSVELLTNELGFLWADDDDTTSKGLTKTIP